MSVTHSKRQTILETDAPRRFFLLLSPDVITSVKCDACERTLTNDYYKVLAIDSDSDAMMVGYACNGGCARKIADEAENVAEEVGDEAEFAVPDGLIPSVTDGSAFFAACTDPADPAVSRLDWLSALLGSIEDGTYAEDAAEDPQANATMMVQCRALLTDLRAAVSAATGGGRTP